MNIFKNTNFFESYGDEKNKVITMLIMAFLITFIYELLRPIKTALIVTAEGSSAEIIPYLRMWVVFPSSILITGIFLKLSNHFSRSKTFYIILSSFLVFFLIFTILFYPYQKTFELGNFAEFLSSKSILKTTELLLIVKYWHLSFFFVFSELWATVVLSILFWGYVNEITPMKSAKKLYGILLLVGNSSVIFSGLLGQLFSSSIFSSFIPFGANAWDKTVYGTLTFVFIMGVSIIFIFAYLDSMVKQKNLTRESKIKIDIIKIFKSHHIMYITFIVIAYNISFNMIEVLWTSKLHQIYSDPTQISAYISRTVSLTGIFSTLFALFVCKQAIQRFGWTTTALITPSICLVMGLAFLLGILLEENFFYQMLISFLDLTPLAFIVLIGAIQISLGKASKYTLFDQTKEMAFIPLSPGEQRTGKVWIEGIVTWAGKLGAALIYQLFLIFGENLALGILYVFLTLLLIWIISVRMLGKAIKTYDIDTQLVEKHNLSEFTARHMNDQNPGIVMNVPTAGVKR